MPVAGQRQGDPRIARHRRDGADGAVHRHVRGVSGARPAVCGGEGRAARAPRRRASCSPAASPIRLPARKRRRRLPAPTASSSPASSQSDAIPSVSRRGRCAGVAAQLRHEHAAEDLSVSPFGPRHRRHAAADAHAGALGRGRDPHRADAGEFRARHPAGDQRSGGGRDESATPQSGSPTRATPTRPTCSARAKPAPRWSREMGSDPLFTKSENHYSYSAYADPAMAASFDAKRFGGPIGQILLADQERVLAEFLGDVSGRRILDMATGTGRAALALARRGAHGHRRRCLARDAERRAHAGGRRGARRSSSPKAMRTRWPFPIARSMPSCACGC